MNWLLHITDDIPNKTECIPNIDLFSHHYIKMFLLYYNCIIVQCFCTLGVPAKEYKISITDSLLHRTEHQMSDDSSISSRASMSAKW